MEPKIVNLFEAHADPEYNGPIFSVGSPDLNCNCLRFDGGEGVPLHINAEVDVAELARTFSELPDTLLSQPEL